MIKNELQPELAADTTRVVCDHCLNTMTASEHTQHAGKCQVCREVGTEQGYLYRVECRPREGYDIDHRLICFSTPDVTAAYNYVEESYREDYGEEDEDYEPDYLDVQPVRDCNGYKILALK